jgi:hypothetical protein
MNKLQAIRHVRWRLSLANEGYRITWSLKDRAAVSSLCIDAAEQSVQSDGAWDCPKCGYFNIDDACGKCGDARPPRR